MDRCSPAGDRRDDRGSSTRRWTSTAACSATGSGPAWALVYRNADDPDPIRAEPHARGLYDPGADRAGPRRALTRPPAGRVRDQIPRDRPGSARPGVANWQGAVIGASRIQPGSVLVLDHFHVVQLANGAVTEVHRRMTLTQRGRRGRASDPEWRIRNRLTRSATRMPGKHVDRPADTLAGPAHQRSAFRSLPCGTPRKTCSTCSPPPRTQPSHEHVHRLLHRFYTRCAASDDLPELPRLATTIETWWPQINAFLTTGITNAGSLRGHQPRHLNRRP